MITTSNLKSQNKYFANVEKTNQLKTYFYLDECNNKVEILSYVPKTHFEKLKTAEDLHNNSPRKIGQGNFGSVFLKNNINSKVVKKQITRLGTDIFNPCRLEFLKNLFISNDFRNAKVGDSFLHEYVCLPFQLQKYSDILYMRKIDGDSLEGIFKENKTVELSKFQIMLLIHSIEMLANQFHMVHTDIHAGNVMLQPDGKLVLIDFDECVSDITCKKPKFILNHEYIENPSNDDYFNGYEDTIPKYIVDDNFNPDEESFYLSKDDFQSKFLSSIAKFKDMFIYEKQPLFNNKSFINMSSFDKNKLKLEIQLRKLSSTDSDDNYLK